MGGSNQSSNLVKLTGREHFICHWLLTKMTEGTHYMKMCFALSRMKSSNRMHQRYQSEITARVYERMRILNAEHRSTLFTGKKLSDEHRAKISKAHTGKIGHPISPETREKIKKANIGRVCKPETRKKLSDSQKGKKIEGTHLENIRLASKNRPAVKQETKEKLRIAFHNNKSINSPDSIAKRRAKRMGHAVSDETRQKIRETLKETYRKKGYKVKDPNEVKIPYVHKGYTHTEEAKQKMRKPKSPETREKMRLASIKREAEKKLKRLN